MSQAVDDLPINLRQLQLLALVSSGKSIDQAAESIHIAPRTAYNTLGVARASTGAGSIAQLAVIALTRGWLILDGKGRVNLAAQFQSDS